MIRALLANAALGAALAAGFIALFAIAITLLAALT